MTNTYTCINSNMRITIAMLAGELKITRAEVRRRIGSGALPKPQKFGGLTFWQRTMLEQFLKLQQEL